MSLSYQSGYNYSLYGTSEDYFPVLTDRGVYDYTCPDYATSLSSCTFNYTTTGGCQANGGPGIVTCQQGTAIFYF